MLGIVPDLLIFDCDGVLVDSEPLSMRVLVECLAEAGLELDPADAQSRFLGKSVAAVCATMSEEFGVELNDSHLERMRSQLYELFRQELQPIAGVADMLHRFPVRRCVASSSQPERIRLSLTVTGLLDWFEPHIYSATMVDQGKPAPDLFLFAAAQMGVPGEACVVVEDSPAGVEAAKRAGMRVLAFTGGAHARGEAHRALLCEHEPDYIFDDMRQLPDILRNVR